jgi:PAS domain S-box-containing protein
LIRTSDDQFSGAWPPGASELAARIRELDWAATPLGPIASWPAELRSSVTLILDSPFPSALAWGPNRVSIFNDAFRTITGSGSELLGRPFAEIWGAAWKEVGPMIDRAFAGQAIFIERFRLTLPGSQLPEEAFFFSCNPIRDADGAVAGVLNTVVELHDTEERLLQFADASQDALWIRRASDLQWTFLSRGFERIYGVSREEALKGNNFASWTELIVPEDRAVAMANIKKVIGGKRVAFEYRVRRPSDGEIRWVRSTDFPMRNSRGDVDRIGGVGHDITPLKQGEERQGLLLAELQHRVRNTLGVIRAIVRRSAETSSSVEDLGMHLDGRIAAFARVQAAVTRDPSAGLDLEGLVAETLRAASVREGDQFSIQGPPIQIVPKAAEILGLALHELMTNAVKYGAFSRRSGHVAVKWDIHRQDGVTPSLQLTWIESGVAHNEVEPEHQGFGTELLTQTLAYELDASVDRRFTSVGVHYSFGIPITTRLVKE